MLKSACGFSLQVFCVVILCVLQVSRAGAATDAAKENYGPNGIFHCGSYPIFEFFDDADGTFVYRKQMIEWKQGHSNTYQKIKRRKDYAIFDAPDITATLKGNDCTLMMNFEKSKKIFKYKICQKGAGKNNCPALTTIVDVTPSKVSQGDSTKTCSVMSAYRKELSKCEVPKITTEKRKKQIIQQCNSITTGSEIEPYTCKYLTRPELEDLVTYNAKVCGEKKVGSLCSAQVKCTWNNSMQRMEGQPLTYTSYAYCPSQAGQCNISAMNCYANRDIYFENERAADELFRAKYSTDLPAESVK